MQNNDDEQQQIQIDKYFKYSHTTNVAHPTLSSHHNLMDSNHNYASSDLRYYSTSQQTQLDPSNSQCIVDEQKDVRCTGIVHTLDQYHQNLEVPKYQQEHAQQQQQQPPPTSQQQPHPQNLDQQVTKGDDDFSVILADVRKTCYSS